MTPQKAIDGFVAHLRRRGCSEHTRRSYRADLCGFFDGRESIEVSYPDCRDWLQRLYESGLAAVSIARKTYSVRSFFDFAKQEGLVSENPARLLQNRKTPKLLPKIPSAEAICRWLDNIRDCAIDRSTGKARSFSGGRNYLIAELLYASGLRVDELIGLDLADIVVGAQTLLIRGKGKKERIGFFGRPAEDALRAYLPLRKRLLASARKKTDALLLNLEGQRLTTRSVARLIKELAKNDQVHPHLFRHAFATHLLEDGMDLISLGELLGHVSVSTTMRYTHLDMTHMRAALEKAHPAETF